MELLREKPIKLFINYLVPSLLSTIVASIYIITDTIMVGRGIGANALIALNLLLPMFSAFFSIGYLLGVGGSVLMSVAKGNNEKDLARTYFSTAIFVALVIGIILTIVLNIFLEPVCYLLGANEVSIDYATEYGRWLMCFIIIFILNPLFQSFTRNDNAPKLCMIGAVVSSFSNVILDYIFIYILDLGMTGAIVATVIGNILNLLITSSHFLKKGTMKFSFKYVDLRKVFLIMKSGASSFLVELSSGIVIFVFNMQILNYIGNIGIVVYSVISNLVLVVNSVLNGCSNAMQPLVSYNLGAKALDRVKKFKEIGFVSSFIVTVVMFLFIFTFPKFCIYMFVEPTEDVLNLGIPAVRYYFLGMFGMCVNIYLSNYFQAVLKPVYSFIISLLRGLVLSILFVEILPNIFGTGVIWLIMPIVEYVTLIFTILFYIRNNKNGIIKE